MENIIEPNETFEFSKLSLAHPSGIQGGAYFTKIEYNSKPLYIQTAKSLTRQGFVKTGKKYYCDLMFDKNAETLINWFENLEIRCQKLILEKKDAWFQNTLEESDIETAFNSIIRIYKSGKYYLVRTNIRNSHTNIPSIKIYDEKEIPLTMSDITNETNIISILEIQGIKFTSRNFQIEIELKQVMLLNSEPIFDNCLIKKDKPFKSLGDLIIQEETNRNPNNLGDLSEENNLNSNSLEVLDDLMLDTENEDTSENLEEFKEKKLEPLDAINNDDSLDNTNVLSDIIIEELVEEDDNDLKEIKVDLNLDNLETIQLKKPNQVYFELYKEARNKAKAAKKNAILAYLEAKNIKKTYMLENLNDSDSDFDAEIDDVSESELENL
jgi:hypothetical protein